MASHARTERIEVASGVFTLARYLACLDALGIADGEGFDPSGAEPENLLRFVDALTGERMRFTSEDALRSLAAAAWAELCSHVHEARRVAQIHTERLERHLGHFPESDPGEHIVEQFLGSLDVASYAGLRTVPLSELYSYLACRSLVVGYEESERAFREGGL